MICKVKGCEEQAKTKMILCEKHWKILPYMARRHITKLLKYNDGIATEEIVSLQKYGYAVVMQHYEKEEEKRFKRWSRRKLL